jgi:hypothetical protein
LLAARGGAGRSLRASSVAGCCTSASPLDALPSLGLAAGGASAGAGSGAAGAGGGGGGAALGALSRDGGGDKQPPATLTTPSRKPTHAAALVWVPPDTDL